MSVIERAPHFNNLSNEERRRKFEENEYAYHLTYGLMCSFPLCCIFYFCVAVDIGVVGVSSGGSNPHILCLECAIKKYGVDKTEQAQTISSLV